jgi:hypothetical protein
MKFPIEIQQIVNINKAGVAERQPKAEFNTVAAVFAATAITATGAVTVVLLAWLLTEVEDDDEEGVPLTALTPPCGVGGSWAFGSTSHTPGV